MMHETASTGFWQYLRSQNSTAYVYMAGQDVTAGGCPELELHDAQGGIRQQIRHKAIIMMSHMPVVAHIHAPKPAEF